MAERDFNRKTQGDEQRHANKEEFEFKVAARRNKLLAGWVGSRLGYSPERTTQYARELISADMAEKGSEDVVRKVVTDFQQTGSPVPDAEVRAQLQRFEKEARGQLEQELSQS